MRDLTADPEDRQIADLVSVPPAIGFAYWVAPGVATERLATLRQGFEDAAKDPEMSAETAKLGGQIRPQSGAAIEAQAKRIADTPQVVLNRVGRMLNARH